MKSFDEKVWNLIKRIPKGKVTTYKEIGEYMNTKAYRAVGQALKRNPHAPKTPCHRVVCSDGSLGGYGGRSKMGMEKKSKLLRSEGVNIEKGKIELARHLYKF